MQTALTRDAGIEVPLICGAMYPCSNPELIAAVSGAGGMGIIQPISMTYVHGHDLREGIRLIRRITDRPIGFNAIVEQSAKIYLDRMRKWIDVALEEGVRFFVTALGNPRWVVERVHAVRTAHLEAHTFQAFPEQGLGVDAHVAALGQRGVVLG